MQDLSRYKKKNHIEIDTKYVSLLITGSIALVGLVFAMGLLVGSRRVVPDQSCKTVDALEKLNEQSGEPMPPKTITAHSFHDILQKEIDNVPTPASLKPSIEDNSAKNGILLNIETVSLEKPRREERPIPEKVLDSEDGSYTLQVGSFQDHREASLLVKRLGRAGHKSFLVTVNMPERGGVWYRVRVGPFRKKSVAWNYKKSFETKENLPAFVVKWRDKI